MPVFVFAPGVQYSRSFEDENELLQLDQAVNIPLMFSYSRDITPWFNLGIAAGPSAALSFGTSGVDVKPFNVNLGSALLFTFAKHFVFNASYEYGMLDRYDGSVDGGSLKTSKLCFGFAYRF